MSGAVSWSQLQQQYMSDAAFHEEIAHMVRELSPVRNKFAISNLLQLVLISLVSVLCLN